MIATASELFEARHFPSVVALAAVALEEEPDCVPLLVVRARAHMALRRDVDAQADLRTVIRLEPRSGVAYRLLGELAVWRDDRESAAAFFREALRLDPHDHEARAWLAIVRDESQGLQPARFPRAVRTHGPTPPDDTATTQRVRARGSRPPPERPVRAMTRGPVTELPGFDEFLVASGVLTRGRLRAAQAYQRSMRVSLSTAIVTLGLATPQRIEWAAVAHQSQRPY